MKFDQKYPTVAGREREFSVPKDVEAEPDLFHTRRIFECVTCQQKTGWVSLRDGVSVHVCSEECWGTEISQPVPKNANFMEYLASIPEPEISMLAAGEYPPPVEEPPTVIRTNMVQGELLPDFGS